MVYRFRIRHRDDDGRLGLAAMLQAFADDQFFPPHLTPEQAAEALRDRFAGVIQRELDRIEVTAVRIDPEGKPATGEPPGGFPPPDAPF